MRSYIYYDGDTFERGGRTFKVEMPYDDTPRCPWEDDCGTGIVSEWTSRDKGPGERLLHSDRSLYRYYDVAETTKKAKRDGWGLSNDDKAKLAERLGRQPTRKQIIAEAVERDYDRLRRWCNDQWSYVEVVVTAIDDKGEDLKSNSLWGSNPTPTTIWPKLHTSWPTKLTRALTRNLLRKCNRRVRTFHFDTT